MFYTLTNLCNLISAAFVLQAVWSPSKSSFRSGVFGCLFSIVSCGLYILAGWMTGAWVAFFVTILWWYVVFFCMKYDYRFQVVAVSTLEGVSDKELTLNIKYEEAEEQAKRHCSAWWSAEIRDIHGVRLATFTQDAAD
jgi:hypothetical protein